MMKTLVAAPTHSGKRYCFPQWVAATEGYDRLVAVREPAYAEMVSAEGVPVVEYTADESYADPRHPSFGDTYNAAFSVLLDEAERGGYTHVLSLETDVIPKCDIKALMEEHYTSGFLCHGVHWRASYNRPGLYAYENCCTLASVEDWRAALAKAQGKTGLYMIVRVWPDKHEVLLTELDHLDTGPESPEGE